MRVLPQDQIVILMNGLVEGQSIRSLERMTGVHRDTIMRWMVRVGQGCKALTDQYVQNIQVRFVQADELVTFIGKKDGGFQPGAVLNGYKGEAWVFIALDADSKLVISYVVGHRTLENTEALLYDVKRRVSTPFQLTSDGFPAYQCAPSVFGEGVKFGQLVKVYRGDQVVSAKPTAIFNEPNVKHISTSYVERHNLTLRMSLKRLTRRTNAFSKTATNHLAALHLYMAHYNFCRVHRSLNMTPALYAGLTDHLWTMDELVQPAYNAFVRGQEA